MALVGFLEPNAPRMSATIDTIERELSKDDLVWPRPHGGDLEQGAFIACRCRLADCRAQQGCREEAMALFERVSSLRHDVGLLSETYHPDSGRPMGNFPQKQRSTRGERWRLVCNRACSATGADPLLGQPPAK